MTICSPRVSVVCAWYNRADYIRETIDSLLNQDYNQFEIIIVNDGSTDPRVRDILDSYDDPRLKVIHGKNKGFTRAIRDAIDASRGEYIAVHGAGDTSTLNRLSAQVEMLDANPALVGCTGEHENVYVGGPSDGLRIIDKGRYPKITYDILMRTIGSPLNQGILMYRRSIYDRIGGYRPFFVYAQDFDLTLRMARHGDFGLIPEVLFTRRVMAVDGIASRVDRSLMQLKYAETAKILSREAEQRGVDTVDIFGEQAGLFLPRSRVVANAEAKTALKYLRMGYPDDADLIADLALREKTTIMTMAIRVIVTASRNRLLRGPIISMLLKLPMKDRRMFTSLVGSRIK